MINTISPGDRTIQWGFRGFNFTGEKRQYAWEEAGQVYLAER